MRICGLQKLSLVDYPGKLAATVFAGGCNLRCPFCHNALLVTRLDESPALEEEEVLRFLESRRGLLDGVVLSGGEPLMQRDATDFLKRIRDLGFPVKVDTNGFFPAVLRRLLEEGLCDYIAMDIKNSPDKYGETVGVPGVDLSSVQESVQMLISCKIPYEFRTTAVREFHTAEDFLVIGRWLKGARQYVIQNFADSGNLISGGLHGFSEEELRTFQKAAEGNLEAVSIRGI